MFSPHSTTFSYPETDLQKSMDYSIQKIRSEMDDPKILRWALIVLLGNLESYQSNKLPLSAHQMLEKRAYQEILSVLQKYKTHPDFVSYCTKILSILAIHSSPDHLTALCQCLPNSQFPALILEILFTDSEKPQETKHYLRDIIKYLFKDTFDLTLILKINYYQMSKTYREMINSTCPIDKELIYLVNNGGLGYRGEVKVKGFEEDYCELLDANEQLTLTIRKLICKSESSSKEYKRERINEFIDGEKRKEVEIPVLAIGGIGSNRQSQGDVEKEICRLKKSIEANEGWFQSENQKNL
jgi:hypothetical protein